MRPVASVVLDSNLFLLYCVGCWRPEQIAIFKRTSRYEEKDFDLLQRYLVQFQSLTITPNTVTEVSNLLGQLHNDHREEIFGTLKGLISQSTEQYVPSSEASDSPCYQRFGITDATLEQLARRGHVVLSDDFALTGTLVKAGLHALNFTQLRVQNWDS